MLNLVGMLSMYSFERRMSSTSTLPRYFCVSAKSIASFFMCSVSVRSARTMLLPWSKVLFSVSSPLGMSMLTTKDGD